MRAVERIDGVEAQYHVVRVLLQVPGDGQLQQLQAVGGARLDERDAADGLRARRQRLLVIPWADPISYTNFIDFHEGLMQYQL